MLLDFSLEGKDKVQCEKCQTNLNLMEKVNVELIIEKVIAL
jgi:hypothetical protein